MIHYSIFLFVGILMLLLLYCVHLSWYHCSIYSILYTNTHVYKSRNNNEYDAVDKYLDQIAEYLTDHFENRMQYAFVCLSCEWVCLCVFHANLESARFIYVIMHSLLLLLFLSLLLLLITVCAILLFQSLSLFQPYMHFDKDSCISLKINPYLSFQ